MMALICRDSAAINTFVILSYHITPKGSLMFHLQSMCDHKLDHAVHARSAANGS